MADSSEIQWTDATWNPTSGCTKISPGCAHCYIERTPPMRMKGRKFVGGKIPLELHENRLDAPLHWKKPRRIFVNSMSDLFHEDVPDEFIDKVFAVMALAPQHTFQVLTKRAERMQKHCSYINFGFNVGLAAMKMVPDFIERFEFDSKAGLPLPNVWLGVSVEDQQRADERIRLLLQTPAAVRFLSCEPLLGPLDGRFNTLDWVIVGGESGPNSRPCNLAWVRSIVAQCKAAGVACFVKQLGQVVIDAHADCHVADDLPHWPRGTQFVATSDDPLTALGYKMRDTKGGDPSEWPEDLRVREFPQMKEAVS